MVEQLATETQISLKDVARERGVSVSTVWRWCLRGIRKTKLESFSNGGRRVTSREALGRFLSAINDEPSASVLGTLIRFVAKLRSSVRRPAES